MPLLREWLPNQQSLNQLCPQQNPRAAAARSPQRSLPYRQLRVADSSQLEKFLVNFVVEQTGYPPEVVELDADLEADLGIDSIKKAQMFGELQEYFDVTPTDDLTLDDFPTLASRLELPGRRTEHRCRSGGSGGESAVAESTAPAAAPAHGSCTGRLSCTPPVPTTTSVASTRRSWKNF